MSSHLVQNMTKEATSHVTQGQGITTTGVPPLIIPGPHAKMTPTVPTSLRRSLDDQNVMVLQAAMIAARTPESVMAEYEGSFSTQTWPVYTEEVTLRSSSPGENGLECGSIAEKMAFRSGILNWQPGGQKAGSVQFTSYPQSVSI